MSASVLRMLRNVGRSWGSVLQHAATRTVSGVRGEGAGSGGGGWGAGGVETNGQHAMLASVLRMLRNVGRSWGSVLQHAATRTVSGVRGEGAGSGGGGWGAGGVETNGQHAMSASVLRMLQNVGRSWGSVLQHAATTGQRGEG